MKRESGLSGLGCCGVWTVQPRTRVLWLAEVALTVPDGPRSRRGDESRNRCRNHLGRAIFASGCLTVTFMAGTSARNYTLDRAKQLRNDLISHEMRESSSLMAIAMMIRDQPCLENTLVRTG